MKAVGLWIIITLIFPVWAVTVYAQTGTITVEISGIDEIKGQLIISLYNQADDFPEIGKEYATVKAKVTGKIVTYIFPDIPPGDYAIAMYHDSNNNGEIDKNFLGIPMEGYGFSRNVSAIFGAPDFTDAAFKLIDHYTAKINLKY